jgi:2-polyprenyl-3-methyl-5-hydroxy-6-metoxy-1,4-benzoquinol methylase
MTTGKVHYTDCPVCRHAGIDPLLTVKDETVSKEHFVIWQCGRCSLRFTQDAPDENAIGAYYKSADYISHSDTNTGIINKLYHAVRKVTLWQKANHVMADTGMKKGRILDVGCGTGAFLNTMKKKGWEVTGIEPDKEAREKAKELYGLPVLEMDHLFTLPTSSFSAITLWHVLEHVHQLNAYLEQLRLLLADEGKLFIAVPNYQSLDSTIYRSHWAAYDVPRHLYHFTPKAMEALVQQHGLTIKEKKPMWFDSFYISLLSSKYRHGKTKPFSAILNGLRSNAKALGNPANCSSVIYCIEKVTN